MKKKRIGLVIWCIVAFLLAAAVVAYLMYEIFVLKIVDSTSIFRTLLLLASLAVTTWRMFARRSSGKVSSAVLREHYRHVIGNTFADDLKTEKRFFAAINLRNQNRYDQAIKAFENLESVCKKNDERFAVIFFEALCYDDIQLYAKAAELYEKALSYREDSTVASNLGLCYQRLGNFERAISVYKWAIKTEPNNVYPYHNIAQLFIRQGAYADALDYAQKAVEMNASFHPALSAQAVCYAMMNNDEAYKETLQRAIACGANGENIRDFIESLKVES